VTAPRREPGRDADPGPTKHTRADDSPSAADTAILVVANVFITAVAVAGAAQYVIGWAT
jgi:hypothetical protein